MTKAVHSEKVQDLLAALDRDSRIDLHHYPIIVREQEDRLVLEGTVVNIAAKKLALRIAQRVCGECPIVDRLRVVASQMEDGQLRAEVVNTLMGEPVFLDYGFRLKHDGGFETWRVTKSKIDEQIDIEVHDGVVTLTGRVGSLTHRRLAEVLAWWTAGCELVENRLRVVPPEKENDGELTDAVRMVLEKDPLVHSSQISVAVDHGEVTLNGYVASDEERQLAVMDAWYVPGVREVVDRIQSRI
jgi:osmotically-inducible protein OsmY